MSFKFSIIFGKSSSPNYTKALNYAKKFDDHFPISEDNKYNRIDIGVEEFRAKIRIIENLYYLINSWKSSRILLNNELVAYPDLRQIMRIIQCSAGYHNSPLPELYCNLHDNAVGWSCKHLKSINRYLPKSGYSYYSNPFWYQFGKFDGENLWVIDKSRIHKALMQEAEQERVTICDVFSEKKINEIIENLPDEINLSESDEWEIEYYEVEDGSIAEKKPFRIKPKSKKDTENEQYGLGELAFRIGNTRLDEKEVERSIPEVKFAEIGGIDDIIETIREVIELPLKNSELFKYLNIKPHKGILLHGPPGCGKTLIAKAIANEIKAHFISIKGPELFSKWHGQSEENLRNIFNEAKELQPSIIYFDEFDSIAQVRSSEETLRLDARFVNQLLTLMDGIEEYGNVCIIASTNRKELLDKALLRPGRFDYVIEVKIPTREGCTKIFQIHTSKMPIAEDVDTLNISEKLYGLSGAEISFVAREGAYNCLRRNINLKEAIENDNFDTFELSKFKITNNDFDLALQKIKSGKTT